jgi:membrane-bound lytic murein transglycosylase MltF
MLSHANSLGISLLALLLLIACSQRKEPPPAAREQAKATAAQTQLATTLTSSPEEPPAPSNALVLPSTLARHTGDLDDMVKRRNIRALVLLNPISFFYQNGHPKGVMYEALQEFQKFANKKLKTGTLGLQVTFIPVRIDQVEAYLTEGFGDLVAYGVAITPDREKRLAFSIPLQSDATQIIVTGSEYGAVATLEGLGGKQVYANPLTTYFANLQKVNESLQKMGKAPIDAD